ncbi:pimeloyl-ACP methyl ester carboxylesterase [Novosphingobium hassiacum]|uniref:Pimeloyl-ACP methyl ester carboxylesterase n=1 Tax=Novosphingobium hassiacum TaxID=173676 RepID=A0A7W5ZX64_9SPHN|nr:alpha/beta hydrolase [Novosphingobium hassiacum]MBB3861610.1 pimeloyl-ACP methyl ester carboxylesterase [Novosphingobium hassiacum]
MDMTRVTLASGIELDVWDTGPKDAPALIFLHGFPESHRTWRHQIAHLSARFRCIAPDQRGYRGSSAPQDVASYTPDKLIGDVFQLADALGVAQFTILGHDWGGAIAWGVALLGQGTRVTRAVIANAPHPVIFPRLLWTDPQQRAASQYMRAFRDTGNDALVREHGLGALLMKALDWKRSPVMEEAERDALLKDWSNPDNAIAMLNWYRASPMAVPPLDAPFALPEGYTDAPLPPLAIPTLVIWAMDDMALPPCNLDGMDKLVPNLTIAQVHDCGHFVPWEAPDKVNAALDRFLA